MRPGATDPPRSRKASAEIVTDGSEIGRIDREVEHVSGSSIITGELQPVAADGQIERGVADVLACELDAASSGETQIAPAALRREPERERRKPFGLERALRGDSARDRRARIGAQRSRIQSARSGIAVEAVRGCEFKPGVAGKRASFRLCTKGLDLQLSATDLGIEGERHAAIAKLAFERSLRCVGSLRQPEVERARETRRIKPRMDAGQIEVLDANAPAHLVGAEARIAANAAPAGERYIERVEAQRIAVISEPRRRAGDRQAAVRPRSAARAR